jgi:SAM-dependent methyltransferase
MKNWFFKKLNYETYYNHREIDRNHGFEEEYWKETKDPDGLTRFIGDEREHKRELASKELEFINTLTPGSILDVGCGTGAIIEGVDNKWKKYGLEVSKYAADEAKKYCDMYVGELKEAKYKDNSFDVVILFHVIEHLEDPLDVLIEIHRILKVGGWLIIGTPNFDGACARRFGSNFRMLHDPTHTSLFSDESLQRMISDHGFVVDRTEFEYFDTKYFTESNLKRLFTTELISPPFYGNIMTKYCQKQSKEDAYERLIYLNACLARVYENS